MWDNVPDNPTDSSVFRAYEHMKLTEKEIVFLAIGGGSVMDATKALAYLCAVQGDRDVFAKALQQPDQHSGKHNVVPASVIAIPTTSGTGSEVTRWATVWGGDGAKYSLSQDVLYPEASFYDPSLCLSMPESVTLASGLDALSHACEAVWNTNATDESDDYALKAIALIAKNLPLALAHKDDVSFRRDMQLASYWAGCAMSLTRTALAHSISYPLTGTYGLTHGIACSFTLPAIAAFNAVENPENEARCQMIAEAMGHDGSARQAIASFLTTLKLPDHIQQHFDGKRPSDLDQLSLINPSRAGNNLRHTTKEDAWHILDDSLKIMGL
jgi:phosphonate metabolism-associated iron-containing alcohol dehydrogenase